MQGWICPAKVNLFFRVLYKRPDGFHEIASLYQAISLHDLLYIQASTEDAFTCTHTSLPLDGSNLVMKALQLFRLKTGDKSPVKIHLDKKIPMEAGLGGGSSNAATMLWALCHLTGRNISNEVLMEWGAELGADVPFFFSTGTAYAEGKGEKLRNIDPLELPAFWIAKPSFGLSTPKVFSVCRSDTFVQRSPLESLKNREFYNDLEGPAFFLSPELKQIKGQLQDMGLDPVVLSGSGTAFFGFGNPKGILPSVDFFSVKPAARKLSSWYEI